MKAVFFIPILFIGALVACTSSENRTEEQPEKVINPVKKDDCAEVTVEDFDEFLGIEYGTKELLIERKLGKFTGGEYSKDSAAFIYYFNRVERVPIAIWVNSKSGEVETVFMEVLSYEDVNFNADLAKAKKEFNISDCDASWFGMQENEVLKRLGEPVVHEYLKDSVLSISYDSQDYSSSVNFKFYPSQNNKCSSISINWFYD